MGRRRERRHERVAQLPAVKVRPFIADLGGEAVAEVGARDALSVLANNTGIAL